jgi:hypothetical protein
MRRVANPPYNYFCKRSNDESTFGIAIFEAENEEVARTIMENDPAVAGGVMRATLYPYRVALMRKS